MKLFLSILVLLAFADHGKAQTPTLDSAKSLSKEIKTAIRPEYTKWINGAVVDYHKQNISPDSIRTLIIRHWEWRVTTTVIPGLYFLTMLELLTAALDASLKLTQTFANLTKEKIQLAYEEYRQGVANLQRILEEIQPIKDSLINNLR